MDLYPEACSMQSAGVLTPRLLLLETIQLEEVL